jgi:hypothetical protein
MVAEHRHQYGWQRTAIQSIAGKIGCTSEAALGAAIGPSLAAATSGSAMSLSLFK